MNTPQEQAAWLGAASFHPMEQENDGLVITDREGIVVHVNAMAERMFYRAAEMFVGKPFGYRIADGKSTVIDIFSPDGTPYQAELSVEAGEWEGKPAYHIVLKRIEDLRNQKIKASLQKSNQRFLSLINASPLAIVTLNNDGTVIFWSRSAEKMFGWSSHEVLGRVPPILSADGNTHFACWCSQVMDREVPPEIELPSQFQRDGSVMDLRVWATHLEDDDGFMGSLMAVIADVTEHKRVEARVQHLGTHDSLTGLPNRVLLIDRLSQTMLKIARDDSEMAAVLVVGLNNFDLILQSLGYVVGDQLLSELAQRMGSVIRQSDTLARYGQDSFAVVLPALEQAHDAVKIAGKILDIFVTPFFFDELEIFLSASVGIAMSTHDGESAEVLLRNADAAMHRANRDNRSGFHFYTHGMNELAAKRLVLVRGLRHSLEREELCLFYQPVIELASGRVVGVEALLRWRHPELGLIPPGDFIPIAEEDGVIVPIGEWVMREGCAQIKRWEAQGMGCLRLAVNLSARQFADVNLPLHVATTLAETGMRPELLEIELTESMLASDVEAAVGMLMQLKSIGVRLSVDDFGTGYSSLSYLKRFPLDVLKIDQSFVREIPSNEDDVKICSTIVAMAHGFNLRVIAEGAETQAQIDFLRGLNCDEIQGFYYSKPLPAGELAEYLQTEQWSNNNRAAA